MTKNIYLKNNVMTEPLINQWYAWLLLYHPATAGLVMNNSQLKIMRSYLKSPKMHKEAVNTPSLLGGPFIDHQAEKAFQIEQLLKKIEEQHADLLSMADDLKSLNSLLIDEAKGEAMLSFYARVPDSLKGFVELVYDLNSQPSLRIIESLLYRSDFFKKSMQSVMLSLVDKDHRPFALSTPRLQKPGKLPLDFTFDDERLDYLYQLKTQADSFENVVNRLQLSSEQQELFKDFVTEKSPCNEDRNYIKDDVRIRYFGHACILLQSKGVSILVDPVISYDYDTELFRYTYADLPDSIDYVLFTHAHQDHLMFEHLLQLRHKVKTVIVPKSNGGRLQDPCLKTFFKSFGYKDVRELSEMESLPIEIGEIIGVPFLGEHGDLDIRGKLAFVVRINGKQVMFAADSNNLEPLLYHHVAKQLGKINILFIGMECDGAPLSWVYGSILLNPLARKFDQSRRLDGSNFDKAKQLVEVFNCNQVYVYAMGQEPWLNYVMCVKHEADSAPIVDSDKLVNYCNEQGITSERLFGSKELVL